MNSGTRTEIHNGNPSEISKPVSTWNLPKVNPPVMPKPPTPPPQQNQWWNSSTWMNSGTRTQTLNGIPSPVSQSPSFMNAQPVISILPVIISPQSFNPQNRIHVSEGDPWPHLTIEGRREDFQPTTGHVPYQGQTTIDMYTKGGVGNLVMQERIQNYPNTFQDSGLRWDQINWR
jgi:hypothetical protein